MPGGSCFSTVCEIDVTCAWRVRMSTLGWKKILTMPKPRQRLDLDVLDVVDRGGQRALVVVDDAPGHVVRRQAA